MLRIVALFSLGILVFIALINICNIFIIEPSRKAKFLILKFDQESKKKGEIKFILDIAQKIQHLIKLSPEKEKRIEKALKIDGRTITPQLYTAYNYVSNLGLIIIFLPLIIIFPISLLGVIILIYISSKDTEKRLMRVVENRAIQIDDELPKFSANISQGLHGDGQITTMFESYINSDFCSPAFKKELEQAMININERNYHVALNRLSESIESPDLTEILRALTSVLNGDIKPERFDKITERLENEQKRRMRKIAESIPNKIMVYGMFCLLATFVYVIGMFIAMAASGVVKL